MMRRNVVTDTKASHLTHCIRMAVGCAREAFVDIDLPAVVANGVSTIVRFLALAAADTLPCDRVASCSAALCGVVCVELDAQENVGVLQLAFRAASIVTHQVSVVALLSYIQKPVRALLVSCTHIKKKYIHLLCYNVDTLRKRQKKDIQIITHTCVCVCVCV